MRRIWAAAFLLRRLRAERGMVVLLVLLVGVTSLLGAAAPRLYNRAADEGLRATVAGAAAGRGNIELTEDAALSTSEETLELLDRMGRTYRGFFPDGVEAIVGAQQTVATTPRFSVIQPPQYTTFLTLRHQTGIEDDVRLVEGRWPASTGEAWPVALFELDPDAPEPPETPPSIEIAVSTTTAEESGLAVGQQFDGSIDGSDPLLPSSPAYRFVIHFEVVGLFEIEDPDAPIWYDDNRLEHVGAVYTINDAIVYVTALFAPDAFPQVLASRLPVRYQWRFFVDAERLDAGSLEATTDGLRRLETTFPRATIGASSTDLPFLRTDLVAIISRYLAQRSASDAVLSIAAIGPTVLAAAAIGMLAVLLNTRRRTQLALARGRGASAGLLLATQAWEAAVVAGVGAILGYATAVLLVPGRGSDLSGTAALAAWLGAVGTLILAAAVLLRGPVDRPSRQVPAPVRLAPRRLVLELTAVGLAVGGIALLQQRGLTIGPAGRGVVRFDPFLAAVPMLAGFAAGLVTARLYPIPVRILGWLAARRRDLVPVLGLRNISRRPSFATLPLLVLLSTAAFGSFALVVMSGLDRGQVEASWRSVGADYRIEAPFGASLAPIQAEAVAGVERVAPAVVNPSVPFSITETTFARIRLVAIDAAAYAEVAEGPVEPSWPAELLETPTAPIGTLDNPIPAILSQAQPDGADPRSPGDVIRVRVGQPTLYFRIVALRPSVAGVVTTGTFLVAGLPAVDAAVPGALVPNVLYIRGTDEALTGLTEAVTGRAPEDTVIESRHAWLAAVRDAPLIRVVADGFLLALGAAVGFAAIAIIGALVLTAAGRAQDLAFLRPLGLSARQIAGIMVVEHGLPILLALAPGIAMGVALGFLLEPSLGLGAFLGDQLEFRIHVDAAGLATVAGLLVVLVVLSIAASTWLARRAPVVDALRAGDA